MPNVRPQIIWERPARILESTVGPRDVAEVTDTLRLMTLRDRLVNARWSVDRLQNVVAKAGSEACAALCEKLGVPGRSIDEIPDMRVLRELVDRLEGRSKRNAEA